MLCDDIARLLPEAVEHGAAVEVSVQRHIETCLRCQAELARYRRMLRGLQMLRTRYLEPAPGLLAQTLAAIEEVGEREARRADPLRSAPRLCRCDRRRRSGRRSGNRGHARAPLPPSHGSRRLTNYRVRAGSRAAATASSVSWSITARRSVASTTGWVSRRTRATRSAPSTLDTTNVARSSAAGAPGPPPRGVRPSHRRSHGMPGHTPR